MATKHTATEHTATEHTAAEHTATEHTATEHTATNQIDSVLEELAHQHQQCCACPGCESWKLYVLQIRMQNLYRKMHQQKQKSQMIDIRLVAHEIDECENHQFNAAIQRYLNSTTLLERVRAILHSSSDIAVKPTTTVVTNRHQHHWLSSMCAQIGFLCVASTNAQCQCCKRCQTFTSQLHAMRHDMLFNRLYPLITLLLQETDTDVLKHSIHRVEKLLFMSALHIYMMWCHNVH